MLYIYRNDVRNGDSFNVAYGTDLEALREKAVRDFSGMHPSDRSRCVAYIAGYDYESYEAYHEALLEGADAEPVYTEEIK